MQSRLPAASLYQKHMAGPGLTRDVLPTGTGGAAGGGRIDFRACVTSNTALSAPVDWSAGAGGRIWGLLIFMGNFLPPRWLTKNFRAKRIILQRSQHVANMRGANIAAKHFYNRDLCGIAGWWRRPSDGGRQYWDMKSLHVIRMNGEHIVAKHLKFGLK